MNAIAEIDKAGRLVVPKKMRDALHLVPGTRLTLRQEGEAIILRQETARHGLSMKNGTWIHDTGLPPSNEVRDWIETDRDARIQAILGDAIKL